MIGRDSRKSRKHGSRVFRVFRQLPCFPCFFAIAVFCRVFLQFCWPFNSFAQFRSVSQYTLVNAPQRQNLTDNNLALHVMMVFNARS